VNVVLLNDCAHIRGGADRVAFDSARGLVERGHKVTLFTAFGPVDPEVADIPGITLICLGGQWIRNERGVGSALSGIWNRFAARRLREVLEELDPTVTIVHAHLYSSALSASVLDAALSAGFATALSLHDYFITCPNGAYFVFPQAERCDRNALSASCLSCNCDSRRSIHKAWRVARTWVQNRVAQIPRRLTAYIAVSETCAALARRDLPANARIEVVPNIVAVDQSPPANPAANASFLFTGRLESYKGPHLLAEAANRLKVPVTFCGSGPMEDELKRICPGGKFTGWVGPERVVEELNRARAFVFSSVYRETFGLSAAEALARGIPVVASRGTAAEEFVHHEKNGLLFDHNSTEDLTRQLARLADDELARRLGTEAYRGYWSAPLTKTAHISKLENFYKSAIEWHCSDQAEGKRNPAAHGHPA
jgi:glycosyltransferase involved in cell wall biosynthesis